jgi:hypothetical protein
MLKLDGVLGTDPPALTAAGAFGHVVPKRPLFRLIAIVQSRSRTIFHTGQTTIAVFVYTKVRHKFSPLFLPLCAAGL